MKFSKIVNHIEKHLQKYFIGLMYIVLIAAFLSRFIPDYIESLKGYDYKDTIKETAIEAYNLDPSILSFDENNISILKMDVLYTPIGDMDYPLIDPLYNKNYEQCAGYLIITKSNDNKLNIDTSHMCEMIDY